MYLKLAFLFSLSLAGAPAPAALPLPLRKKPTPTKSSHHSLSPPPPPRPKATVSDLLSLLGPPQQAESVNSCVAQNLRPLLRFLVPFSNQTSTATSEIDELILSPPPPVLELARLAVDSGADPGSIHRSLNPTAVPVPDVEGSDECRCQLTRTPYGRQFINEGLNSYIKFLFQTIISRGPSVGMNVSLSRYDLFHGHLFIALESKRLGILFHAKEYPAFDKELFPCNMGYCQVGSNVGYDENSMNLRNILWLAPLPGDDCMERASWIAPGVLVVLDASPQGVIYQDLIPEYVQFVRTLYEEDFGEVVVDVNYLNVGGEGDLSRFEIFIC